jgi:PKD repeat protein/agmatine/peptidylarginine deiminase
MFSQKVRKFSQLAVLLLMMVAISTPFFAQAKAKKLTHRMSDEEKALMPAYLAAQQQRAVVAPTSPVRAIAEFEPMEGVLIAYPLGIPTSLVKEMAEDLMVYTLVSGTSQENQARSSYSSAGVNMSNCTFIQIPTDSYWSRDYGPWFVADGSGSINIVDFTYNRPRYNDNNVPSQLGNYFNIDVYQMDLTHCGGNYMTDGMGIAVSTDLVWEENSGKTHDQINQIMQSYLGIQTYHVTTDPLGDYIKHVDCWGKYLDVDKILIARVPLSNSQYSEYEAMATFFAGQTTSYGNTYQVYRVDENNSQPYTNSIILNDKVLVPITGSSADSAAISAYQQAMPGYQVLGMTGSWQSTDALHCRTIGIADRGMLYINHMPLLGEKAVQSNYSITAEIIPYSGQPVTTNSVKVYYRVNSGSYQTVTMTHSGGDTYTGTIPGQTSGTQIGYYITAADGSGRTNNHPYIGSPDPHVFTIGSGSAGGPTAQFTADTQNIITGGTVQFTDQSTNTPTSWQWNFGDNQTSTQQNPSHTYSATGTYTVTLTVTNSSGSDTETKTNYITVSDTQYCDASGQSYNYEWLAGVEVGDLNNTSGASGYTDFTSLTANLTAGATVNVTLTPGFDGGSYTEYFRIWIDYNGDKDFSDSGEEVFSESGSSAVTGSFTVPADATGTTRMRVAMKYNGYAASCESISYGEVEDYTVSFSGSGTVIAPTAAFSASTTAVTTGQTVTFTDQSTNNPTAWSWTFDGGTPGTGSTQNPTVTYNTAGTYSVALTVSNSAGSDTETKTGYITVTDAAISYCNSQGSDFSYEWISGVQIGSLNNTSNASGYTDFTTQTVTATAGDTLSLTLTPTFSGSSYDEYWKIWIDYNRDGDFDDPGEEVFSGSGSSAVTGSFVIPATASGTTRIRVSMKYGSYATSCEQFTYGEVEDYTIIIN